MRAAMTRRTMVTNAAEAIDEVDSPVDALEEGMLTIQAQSSGNIKGKDSSISFTKLHSC